MKTHFLDPKDIEEFRNKVNLMYVYILERLKNLCDSYIEKISYIDQDNEDYEFLRSSINEFCDAIDQMKEIEFTKLFVDIIIEFSKKIRFETVKNYNIECVLIAIFDICFKYNFDVTYNIRHPKSTKKNFKLLQFNILNDCNWKINP